MANEIAMFDPKAGMPAHVAAFFGQEGGSNIEDRAKVPSLSPQGKTWTISVDGNKTKLMRPLDGDMVPVSVLRVVVLDFAKRRGRAYYEGAYDPEKESAPICWSDDGITPDDTVPADVKQNKTAFACDKCPMAAKGSKIADGGKAVTACSQHRMLAVVPENKLDFKPLRLKIAITSDWDKESPGAAAEGWFAFQNYMDYLKSRGVQHSAAVVTKMKFDSDATYPKIFFAAERWLNPDELAIVAPLTKSDEVQKLLGGTYTPAGVDGVNKHQTTAAPPGEQTSQVEQKPEPAATAATAASSQTGTAQSTPASASPAAAQTADDDGGGEIVMVGIDAPAAKPDQGPAQAGVAAPEAAQTTEQPKAAVAPPTEPAPQATAAVDPELAGLLADWGGE
jgi:hypothetical protein